MNVEKMNDVVFKFDFGNPSNPINIVSFFSLEKANSLKVKKMGEDEEITVFDGKNPLATLKNYHVENERSCVEMYSKQAHFFGFGEKMGYLDKRGRKMEMLTTDNPLHLPDTDPMYVSIPFFIVVSPNKPAIGFYINSTSKTTFDIQGDRYNFCVDDAGMEFYMIYGPSVLEVVQHFSSLVGKMQLPPAWSLGYQQSRWSYFTSDEVMNVAERMRKDEIPCDVIYLDIDYMDGYRVFTWSQNFPDPKKTIGELKKMGFKVVTIVDPGVKEEEGYEVYDSGIKENVFVKTKGEKTFTGYVWPGKCNFPDFLKSNVRKWWSLQHKNLFDMGVDGIWNDMNEPSIVWDDEKSDELKKIVSEKKEFDFSVLDKLKSFSNQKYYLHDIVHEDDNGKKWEHFKVRNVYALLEAEATFGAFETFKKGKRPFILSRSGFAGIQKYAAIWTGDNSSWWEHLEREMAISMGLSLSGVSFCGTDVGGFGGNSTSELLIRWTEMGVFFPFFRNHSAIGTRHQEPWSFDKNTEEIIKKHIRKRYELFPHLYNLFYESSQKGTPIMRPLLMSDQNDETLYSIDDEFMVGDSILVAPITRPNTFWRTVYLPKGKWFDVRNNNVYEGKRVYKIEAPLDEIPVFIKENSMIFKTEPANFIFEKEKMPLYVDIYGSEARTTFYEDDGETLEYKNGKYNFFEISFGKIADAYHIDIKKTHAGYAGRYEKITFRFPTHTGNFSYVYLNGKVAKASFKDGILQVEMEVKDLR